MSDFWASGVQIKFEPVKDILENDGKLHSEKLKENPES